ncbi:MAG: UDP-3-O-acyl-N-acetylglucosamine deacetylase [Pseudomonadota bacterium]|nr:UDP-3-O-acyl-N-acetylglucosamine deacetylase [Pseudomonadota bacterium]
MFLLSCGVKKQKQLTSFEKDFCAMLNQKTICNEVSCLGVGLHSGAPISMKILPAKENTGIVFRRVDLNPAVEIKADFFNVKETKLATCLIVDEVRVSTIEHLMSALFALGLDNLVVEIDGPELPIMDGSASPFIFVLQSAGIIEQNELKKLIFVKKDITFIGDNGEKCSFSPSENIKYNISTDFSHPHNCFSDVNQSLSFNLSLSAYQKEISRARTFGFMSQYEELKKNNLARGGGMHNAIVFDNFKVLNENGLRFDNEPVRHKLLDLMGDLYLAGSQIIAEVTAHKPGHKVNNLALRKLMEHTSAWDYVEINNNSDLELLNHGRIYSV